MTGAGIEAVSFGIAGGRPSEACTGIVTVEVRARGGGSGHGSALAGCVGTLARTSASPGAAVAGPSPGAGVVGGPSPGAVFDASGGFGVDAAAEASAAFAGAPPSAIG